MVILNSAQAAVDLLDRKSSIYSDRPHMVMIGEMVGWTRIVSLHNYGPRFRETRRLLSQMLGSREKVANLAPLLEAEEHRFLLRVMRDPASLVAQVRKYVGLCWVRKVDVRADGGIFQGRWLDYSYAGVWVRGRGRRRPVRVHRRESDVGSVECRNTRRVSR